MNEQMNDEGLKNEDVTNTSCKWLQNQCSNKLVHRMDEQNEPTNQANITK